MKAGPVFAALADGIEVFLLLLGNCPKLPPNCGIGAASQQQH
jgi:hypothetical protein